MGSGCIDPRFLDFGNSWRWVVSFTHLPVYPRGKSLRCSVDKSLGGTLSRSGRYGEVKIHDPTDSKSDLLVVQPVAFWLSWRASQIIQFKYTSLTLEGFLWNCCHYSQNRLDTHKVVELRRLVAIFPQYSLGFNPGSGHMGFVVVLGFPLQGLIH
jgi:hypothetical protein